MQQKRWSWWSGLALGLAATVLVSGVRAEEEEQAKKDKEANKAKEAKKENAAKKADPRGTWKWERTFGERTFKSTLKLVLEGDKLTGTYKGRGDEVKIENARLEGDKLSFQYTRRFNDREITFKYQGKVTASTIKGTLEFSSGDRTRNLEWEAKRTVEFADILGLWKIKRKRDNGEIIESSIRLTGEGDKLKGLYTSRWGELQARDIKLNANELSFVLSRETDSGGFRAVYKGKVSGNIIKGTMKYRFGDREGTREFEGRREVKKEKRPVKIAAILGKWNFEVTTDGGETLKPSILITREGDRLKGLYTSRYGEREAKKIQLKGDALSFEISGETDNGGFLIVYKGKLSGDSIKGTIDYQFGDRKGSTEFTGRRKAKKEPEKEKKPAGEGTETAPTKEV